MLLLCFHDTAHQVMQDFIHQPQGPELSPAPPGWARGPGPGAQGWVPGTHGPKGPKGPFFFKHYGHSIIKLLEIGTFSFWGLGYLASGDWVI